MGANSGITLSGIGLRVLGVSNVIIQYVRLSCPARSFLPDEIHSTETSKSPRFWHLLVMRSEFRYSPLVSIHSYFLVLNLE